MAANVNTILLKGCGHHDEGRADSAIYPGEAVRLAADGKYDPETLSAQVAAGRGLKIATENALAGKTVATAYAAADLLFFYSPLPGDHVHVLAKAGEDIDIGDYLDVEGSGSGKFIKVAATATAEIKLPLTNGRVWDALQTVLPGTAANDDMGITTGTPGTAAPSLRGVDFGGAATDERASFEFIVPQTYRAGAPLTLRVNAGILTTVAATALTVDALVYKDAGTGAVGADICATAAQSINSLVFANKDFTITPTGIVPGDRLIIILIFTGSDGTDLGVMIPEIRNASVLLGNAAVGRLEALEDSGGALAAAGLIRCRVLSV